MRTGYADPDLRSNVLGTVIERAAAEWPDRSHPFRRLTMRTTRWMAASAVTAAVVGLLGATMIEDGHDHPVSDELAGAMSPEMMKAWQAYSTPGPQQARLAERVGDWDVTISHWIMPGAPPQISQGHSEMEMIFDGRFLVQEFESDSDGMPFEGLGYSGFNNKTGTFQFTWVDSLSTGIMFGEGRFEKNVLTWYGTATDPMTGDMKIRGTETFDDPNRFVSRMFMTGPDGKEFKSMEFLYVRAAGDGGGDHDHGHSHGDHPHHDHPGH